MKKHLKCLQIIVLLIALAFCTVSCDNMQASVQATTEKEALGETEISEPFDDGADEKNNKKEKEECPHMDITEMVEVEALALRDGVMRVSCNQCKGSYTEEIPATKSVRILSIGNSFSMDSVEYLWKICEDGGVEKIEIGHLYYGGCSLDNHWDFMKNDRAEYTYYENTDGEMKTFNGYKASTAIARRKWEYIVIQQVSGSSGMPDHYGNLENVIDYVEERKTNGDAKLVWHMTWAYQSDSTHAHFARYGNDQISMYNAIVDTVEEKILTNEKIDFVISTGTAIQNLRSSYVGDTLTRDGYHLNYGQGRYTAALTWFVVITGGDPDNVDWFPSGYSYIKSDFEPIREAVKNAVANPFEITESNFKNK